MRVIGLSGYAGSGKDTLARMLLEEHGFEHRAFADIMRHALLALDPYIAPALRLSEVVHNEGWDSAKRAHPEVRALLQRFGTDCVRNHLGNNIWVDALLSSFSTKQKYVISDVRFQNEALGIQDLWIKNMVGEVWRIERPGCGPANDHISEHDLGGFIFDFIYDNAGSLEDMRLWVKSLVL